MKKNILTFLAGLVFLTVNAQTYTVTPIPYNPLPFDSGIQVVNPIDDQWGQVLGIGFDFYFFGQPYQNLIVGTNGQLSYNISNAGKLASWQIGNTIPDDVFNGILAPWQDMDITNTGKIIHQVYGTPPNRRFVVSFDSLPLFGSPLSVNPTPNCPDDRFLGQVVLYEGSSVIDVYIGNKNYCAVWNNGLALEGIINANGSQIYSVPGRWGTTPWSAVNDAWRFTPDSTLIGSNTNRISGRVFADLNQNCVFDGSDYPLRNKPVVFTDLFSGLISYVFTDQQGYYSKLVHGGNYNFTTYNVANNLYASNCPPSGTYNVHFTGVNDSSDNNLFADTLFQPCSSLTTSLHITRNDSSTFSAIYSCDSALIRLQCINNGTVSDSATLVLSMNDSVSVISASSAYTLSANTYRFPVGRLNPGDDTTIMIHIKVGCDSTAAQYCFSAFAETLYPGQCSGSNNGSNICRFLGQPYDPNALYVSSTMQPEKGDVKLLQTYSNDTLNYTVHFQNTGNSPAVNVKVKIPLSAKIDTSSLVLTGSSFTYSWLVLNKTLIVDFNNINLPDTSAGQAASSGYFKFTVKQKPGNVYGDSIVHTAGIYFDNNAPINTNRNVVKILPLHPNHAPVVLNDTITGHPFLADTLYPLPQAASDMDGDSLCITSVIASTHFTRLNCKAIRFGVSVSFSGTDSCKYVVCDNGQPVLCDTAVLVFKYVNNRPVAVNDTETIYQLQKDTLYPTSNDMDTDNDDLCVMSVYGSNRFVNTGGCGPVIFTPDSTFTGKDSCWYIVCDRGFLPISECDTAFIFINYMNNHAPTALSDTITLTQATTDTLSALANDIDIDGDSLCISGIYGSSHFSVSGCSKLLFERDAAFTGKDTCWYIVCDNGVPALCDTAIVIVTVNVDYGLWPVAKFIEDTAFNDPYTIFNCHGNVADAYANYKVENRSVNADSVIWSFRSISTICVDTVRYYSEDTVSFSLSTIFSPGCIAFDHLEVCLTAFNNYGQTSKCDTVCLISWGGINELSSSGILISPNPTAGLCTINVNSNGLELSASLTDVTGREVLPLFRRQAVSGFTFSTASLPGGLYFIRVFDSVGKYVVAKMVKQ